MKYLRKIIYLAIAVVFVASVIIGIGIIFSVKNVNVSLLSYTYPEREVMTEEESHAADKVIEDFRQEILSEYRGTLLSFVDGDELSAKFQNTNYTLESFEKIYPCTINLIIKERREVFYTSVGEDLFNTYDSRGILMRERIPEPECLNNIDNAPNVLAVFEESVDEEADSAAYMGTIADMAAAFTKEFGALRTIVESIELYPRTNRLIFNFHCGVSLRISDFYNLTEAKMSAAHEKFLSLTGEEKLSGNITVAVNGTTGNVVAEYFNGTSA